MKKSELRNLVREHLRTRFMFEKEEPDQPEDNGPETTDPMPEPPGSPTPHEQAIQMGLVDKKFGRYGDPQTGKIVAKIVNGNLVKVEPEDPEEKRTAPEPKVSGFNYDDPYGEDYPKPKGQLGAVPPEFKPVMNPAIKSVVDTPYDDPYAATTPQKLGGTRPQKYSLGSIIGTDQAKDAISRRDYLGQDGRDAYSDGGFGTFKGSEPKPGDRSGPQPTPDVDISPEKNQGRRVATDMIAKYGSAEKALDVLKRNRDRVEQQFRQLQNHNTNSTPERLKKLGDFQRVIDRLTFAEEELLKQSDRTKVHGENMVIMLRNLVSEEVMEFMMESEASEQAKKLGLVSKGWGRYYDKSGKLVAKSVNGRLVKVEDMGDESTVPEDDGQELDIHPETSKEMDKLFAMFGHEKKEYPYSRTKTPWHPRVKPGWNKGTGKEVEVEFDANAEQTVAELLKKVGDPDKLMRWLVKKFKTATAKGKKRIAQYIGILKKMGEADPADVQGGESISLPNTPM